jgi:hypothetical protein
MYWDTHEQLKNLTVLQEKTIETTQASLPTHENQANKPPW